MEILIGLFLLVNVFLLWWRDMHHTRQIVALSFAVAMLETRLDRAGLAK